jgi:hypothetical protein
MLLPTEAIGARADAGRKRLAVRPNRTKSVDFTSPVKTLLFLLVKLKNTIATHFQEK